MLEYDEANVTYETLMDIFLSNVDPFDQEGQFIDKGFSYTLAVFYMDDKQKEMALKKIAMLEEENGKKAAIAVEAFKSFYPAEEYHQDFYLKNPEKFKAEIIESGRTNFDLSKL